SYGLLLRRPSAIDAQGGFGPRFETGFGDILAATDAFAIGAVRDPGERALDRGDLPGDQRSLAFERGVILHLDRLFAAVGIERFGQILGDMGLAGLQLGELGFVRGPGGGGVGHAMVPHSCWTGRYQAQGPAKSESAGHRYRAMVAKPRLPLSPHGNRFPLGCRAMARPLSTGKQPVNLATPEVRVSKIRRDPPPKLKEIVIRDRDDHNRRMAAIGIAAF